MQKFKLILFGLVSLAGIGSSFATNHRSASKKRMAYTYYAIANGNPLTYFSWTAIAPPMLAVCAAFPLSVVYCTITTNQPYRPAPGQFPIQPYNHSINGNLYQ